MQALVASENREDAWIAYCARNHGRATASREAFDMIEHQVISAMSPTDGVTTRIRSRVQILSIQRTQILGEWLAWLSPKSSLSVVIGIVGVAVLTAALHRSSNTTAIPPNLGHSIAMVCIVLFSAFVHELGHAAALIRFQQTPSAISFGVRYFIYPCLFTDVSRAWHLTARQRILVNLGGVYFQSLFALALLLAGCFNTTIIGLVLREASTACVLLCAFQLIPFHGSDGDWIVRDATSLHLSSRKFIVNFLNYFGWLALGTVTIFAYRSSLFLHREIMSVLEGSRSSGQLISANTVYSIALIVIVMRGTPATCRRLYRHVVHLYGKK